MGGLYCLFLLPYGSRHIDPIQGHALSVYPMKTKENRFLCFQGFIEKKLWTKMGQAILPKLL